MFRIPVQQSEHTNEKRISQKTQQFQSSADGNRTMDYGWVIGKFLLRLGNFVIPKLNFTHLAFWI
jgi:hypothetical protein